MKGRSITGNFEQLLGDLTTEEPEVWLITPYRLNGKPFCGTFDKATFVLTRNSFWKHVKLITISGTFRKSSDGTTEVLYDIGLTKRVKTLALVLFCFAFAGLNAIFFFNSHNLASSEVLTLNSFLTFALLWGQLVNAVTRRIVHERFRTEFEIVD